MQQVRKTIPERMARPTFVDALKSASLCLLLLMPVYGLAQSPAPLTHPDLHLGLPANVEAVVVLPDGSMVFGGYFTEVDGVPRANIAKLDPSGALDLNWNPSANRGVEALATDPSGNVYVAGKFWTIGGQARNHIAKLGGGGSGAADPDWDPSPDGEVTTLATDASGRVYVGGGFTNIGGKARSNIARLAVNGDADPDWDPSADRAVSTLVTDLNGNVYAAGWFLSIGGQARNDKYIAKLLATGSGAADPAWDPSTVGDVYALATDPSGHVYVGGAFTTIGGQARRYIAKLSSSGAVDPDWVPSANSSVRALAIDPDGSVYVGGAFSTIGGQARNHLAKLTASGTADPDWNPSPDSYYVTALATDPSGHVSVGGTFSIIGGQMHLGGAILSGLDGSVLGGADFTNPGTVYSLAMQAAGGIIVGGNFDVANGLPRHNILRLAADGTLDPDWNPSADGDVYALDIDPGGNVYVGGRFATIGGKARSHIAKLAGNGAVDPDWDPSADGVVDALATDLSGNVYVGGRFATIGGKARSHIAKLAGSGAADPAWNPSADDDVHALAIDPSGSVYVGGEFTNIGGNARNYIAKLAGNGSGDADPAWNPSADGFPVEVDALAIDPGGNIYVGGYFSTIGGKARNNIAKLAGSGSGDADPAWDPSADYDVYALAIDPSGNVYVGGVFEYIGGQYRNNIAKLSGTGVGAADPAWNPSPDGDVLTLATDASGRIYVGGRFTNIGGQQRAGLAALPQEPPPDLIFRNGFEP